MSTSQLRFLALLSVATALLASACSSIVYDDDGVARERRPAVIHYHQDSIFTLAPTEASVGETFAVSVRSYTTECTVSGPTFIYVNGLTANVEPSDRYPVKKVDPDNICHLGVAFALHAGPVTFSQRGLATIYFHGRREPGGSTVTGVRQVLIK